MVRPLPKAAMFALAEEGHRSLFEQLVACILSIRTRDEVSLEAARRLFATARRPEHIVRLGAAKLNRLTRPRPGRFWRSPAARQRSTAGVCPVMIVTT